MMQASKGSGRRPESPRDVLTCERGHAMPDRRGRCWRCGRPADTTPETQEER
jgi:hypothetical protein